MRDICHVHNLGLIEYGRAVRLQDALVAARSEGTMPDTMLILEHLAVITTGTAGGEENIAVAKETLLREGIALAHTDRGGNATCHEPGQLVGYPILDLQSRGRDIHQYVRELEETIICTLADFGIPSYRDPRYPGVWTSGKKICALGIRVKHWVTKHGFALNVNNDMRAFAFVRACGIAGCQVTSMSQELGREVTIEEVIPCFLRHFGQVFQVSTRQFVVAGAAGEGVWEAISRLYASGSESQIALPPDAAARGGLIGMVSQ
ncbi:MAG: lipoyl(octanoyl) transferase LipB [Chloroflexi bacterium]|nr:lipoyl(octanoyl) transferase LipB [Chloroflexota bacterium]